jgi:hypothetical protein
MLGKLPSHYGADEGGLKGFPFTTTFDTLSPL